MTIEEAKQMATQGDIGAMCSLGDFYIKQNTGEGIKEASKWYESEESVDFVKKNWEEVYDWALKEIEMLDDNVPGSVRKL